MTLPAGLLTPVTPPSREAAGRATLLERAAGDRGAVDPRLLKAVQQLQGTFAQEMFKAMRATVHADGLGSGGSAEQMFTGVMDQEVADQLAAQWRHNGLEQVLLRQLTARTEEATADVPTAGPSSAGAMPMAAANTRLRGDGQAFGPLAPAVPPPAPAPLRSPLPPRPAAVATVPAPTIPPPPLPPLPIVPPRPRLP